MYNSETLCVEESMHVQFDDKELGDKTSKQDEGFAEIQISEDTPEPDQIVESEDGSEQADLSRNTFKYKSSHPKDQIIGNKENPRRTRSYFSKKIQ